MYKKRDVHVKTCCLHLLLFWRSRYRRRRLVFHKTGYSFFKKGIYWSLGLTFVSHSHDRLLSWLNPACCVSKVFFAIGTDKPKPFASVSTLFEQGEWMFRENHIETLNRVVWVEYWNLKELISNGAWMSIDASLWQWILKKTNGNNNVKNSVSGIWKSIHLP